MTPKPSMHERGALFNEACRIAVEDGQFPFAWIGARYSIQKPALAPQAKV